MESTAVEITFEGLMYRLAVANAKLQDKVQADLEATLRERQEILELIVRTRRRQDELVGFS